MTDRRTPWPDLVEQALFHPDPSRRRQLIEAAMEAINERLRDLETQKEMLVESRDKLRTIALTEVERRKVN